MAEVNNNPINVNNLPEQPLQPVVAQEGRGFGHKFKVVKEKIKHFFMDAFHAIAESFNKRSPLGKIFKLSINVLTGVGSVAGPGFRGAGLLRSVTVLDNFNDCLDIAGDVSHFVNGNYKNSKGNINKSKLIASLAFFAADVGGLVLWLNDLMILPLAKASAAIGRGFSKLAAALGPRFTNFVNTAVKTLPFVAKVAAKVTLVNVVRSVVGVAFLALAANECRKIVKAIRERDIKEVINHSLYLVSYIAEVALKVLAIVSCTCVPGLVAVGCIAAGFGLAAFIMEVVRKIQEERAKEKAQEAAAAQRPVPQRNMQINTAAVAA